MCFAQINELLMESWGNYLFTTIGVRREKKDSKDRRDRRFDVHVERRQHSFHLSPLKLGSSNYIVKRYSDEEDDNTIIHT